MKRAAILASLIVIVAIISQTVQTALINSRADKVVSQSRKQTEIITKQNGVINNQGQQISNLSQSVTDLSSAVDDLTTTVNVLLPENRRSLDCTGLYLTGHPSTSPVCSDVNARLDQLKAGGTPVFNTSPPTQSESITPATTTTTTTTTTPAPVVVEHADIPSGILCGLPILKILCAN